MKNIELLKSIVRETLLEAAVPNATKYMNPQELEKWGELYARHVGIGESTYNKLYMLMHDKNHVLPNPTSRDWDIDETIKLTNFRCESPVYRGLYRTEIAQITNIGSGGTWSPKAYKSWSVNPGVAITFANFVGRNPQIVKTVAVCNNLRGFPLSEFYTFDKLLKKRKKLKDNTIPLPQIEGEEEWMTEWTANFSIEDISEGSGQFEGFQVVHLTQL